MGETGLLAFIVHTALAMLLVPRVEAGSGAVLYRLPVRSLLDSTVVSVFEAALDTVLSTKFRVIVPTDSNPHHPDSNVCSAELVEIGAQALSLSYEIYPAGQETVISGGIEVPDSILSLASIVLALQGALSPNGFGRLSVARIRLDGHKDTRVFLDGALYGTIPFEAVVVPGHHEVEVRGTRLLRSKLTLDLGEGEDTLAVVDLKELSRPVRLGLLAIGAVGTGFAVYMHREQGNLYKRYADPHRTRSDFDERYSAYRRAVVARDILGGTAALTALTSLLLTIDLP